MTWSSNLKCFFFHKKSDFIHFYYELLSDRGIMLHFWNNGKTRCIFVVLILAIHLMYFIAHFTAIELKMCIKCFHSTRAHLCLRYQLIIIIPWFIYQADLLVVIFGKYFFYVKFSSFLQQYYVTFYSRFILFYQNCVYVGSF